MDFNFDKVVNRRLTESIKWNKFGEDVIPMWIADMDFQCPDLMLNSIIGRTKHGIFGYSKQSELLQKIIVERTLLSNQWPIDADSLFFSPSVLTSLSLFLTVSTAPGDEVIVFTPSYPPLINIPKDFDLNVKTVDLVSNTDCGYEIDFDAFERSITPRTRILLLCNPHNPTGRCFTRSELNRIAEICLEHDLLIVSDDIHSDLVYTNSKYIPISSISRDIKDRTVTFFGPGKTFNMAGLKISMVVIPNREIRQRFNSISNKYHVACNVLSFLAAEIAYRDCQLWQDNLVSYLKGNRDTLIDFISKKLPGIKIFNQESTYLAWLDCRQLHINEEPVDFFLNQAGIAFNDGRSFGECGDGFVRMNFGCPKTILLEALSRMQRAIDLSCK